MPTNHAYRVYILTNKPRGVLYIGFTNNLKRRTTEHRSPSNRGFTSRYRVHRLVYYEPFEKSYDAKSRERQMKKWNRAWKIHLIEKHNPNWTDLCQNDGTILDLPIAHSPTP